MRVFNHTAEAAGILSRAVVTTGSFDGVHIGHKSIIDNLNQIASEIGGESVLITFHPHPRKVLYPEQTDLKLINTQEEKIRLLEKAGLQNLIILPFTREFSRTTSHDFVMEMLIGQLQAKVIVVGHNHHFGHNRQGDYSYLHNLGVSHGFRVEEIPLLDIENETVSSTKIRKALFEGNIQRANAYLDHPYIISGPILPGAALPGRFANRSLGTGITEEEKLVPPPGIYATNLQSGSSWLKAMSIIQEDAAGKAMVTTCLLYDEVPQAGSEAILHFYKKIGSMNQDGISKDVLEDAWEMAEDLIY